MPPKRKSIDAEVSASAVPATSKKQKVGTTQGNHTLEELLSWEHDELAEYAFSLQTSATPQQAAPTKKGAAAAVSAPSALTADEINTKAALLQQAIERGVRKDMKWQNSCRNGTSRFAFSTGVACDEVMLRALRLPDGKKQWKQKKITIAEFQACVGYVKKSIRYGVLVLTGENVIIKWSPEDNTLRVSGTYGMPQVQKFDDE
ncbi:hypothetical protein B0T25DRAFT_363753 [Lasiosphaeria hispida]|uniref:Uncharacterized protein n=1 Tax=Lasiosphaeria hispida TaxID=260671 RepID=A0AAJ0H5A6_9PEZI|nr:hypothetical protein B0T25DRAFT_363753 [Lasiosphaeria hispida]